MFWPTILLLLHEVPIGIFLDICQQKDNKNKVIHQFTQTTHLYVSNNDSNTHWRRRRWLAERYFVCHICLSSQKSYLITVTISVKKIFLTRMWYLNDSKYAGSFCRYFPFSQMFLPKFQKNFHYEICSLLAVTTTFKLPSPNIDNSLLHHYSLIVLMNNPFIWQNCINLSPYH